MPVVDAVLRSLWSDGGRDVVIVRGVDQPDGYRCVDRYVALPDVRAARFLVPVARRSTMASILASYPALRDRRTRVARRAAAVVASAGLCGRPVGERVTVHVARRDLSGDDQRGFVDAVRRAAGLDDVVAGIGVGNVDQHFKPTLQLFTRTGRAAAFAKLGWTGATATLVRREAAALSSWWAGRPPPGGVRPPRLLHAGRWGGMDYVVTAPLPADVRRTGPRDPLASAARQIAAPLHLRTLRESRWWSDVRRRLATADCGGGHRGSALVHAVQLVDDSAGDAAWRFGRWHGDWTRWNVATSGDAVHVWDWEHSTPEAPWGFDLLHWQVTVAHIDGSVPYGHSVRRALQHAHVPEQPAPLDLLVLAYLIEMMLRSSELTGLNERADELYDGLTRSLEQVMSHVARRLS